MPDLGADLQAGSATAVDLLQQLPCTNAKVPSDVGDEIDDTGIQHGY
jgi:hypothetical protein